MKRTHDFLLSASLGLATTIVLIIFFSPPVAEFAAWHLMPGQYGDLVSVRRGVVVEQQVVDPFAEIRDPIHKILRWRLLFPMIGHVLHLPPGGVLALSPIGCVLVLSVVIGCAHRRGIPWLECGLLGVVSGATAWFFVATGWLGYFDSWLVLGLLAVSFARRTWVVVLACLLTPWIDERFIFGFPIAMLVRWLEDDRSMHRSAADLMRWLLREGSLPAVVLLSLAALRVSLIGKGGTLDWSTYWQHVAFTRLPVTRLAFGAWEGLRAGWVLLACAVLALVDRGDRLAGWLLAFGLAATTVVGLATSNDLSRSAALSLPAIPFAWRVTRQTEEWRRLRIPWVLAVAALVLPAHHVVSDFVIRIDPIWVQIRLLIESGLLAKLLGS